MAKAKTTKTAEAKKAAKSTSKPAATKVAKAAPKAKAAKTSPKAKAGGKGDINQDLIRALANLLDETGLTEIEIDGSRVRVARTPVAAYAAPAASAPRPAAATAAPVQTVAESASASIDHAKHPGVVLSPMVGTAYVAAEPGAKPFVEVGTRVKAGQTLLIIEAMKTMNQIPAPRDGTVTQILFDDGQPVEFGEPLMIVE
jgi:acetyl-CoA carboxylase biotin carboxyl carrier protein